MEKVPLVIEKYFRANRSKEMKIKNLLKFFLFLEEDCNMKGLLYHIGNTSFLSA